VYVNELVEILLVEFQILNKLGIPTNKFDSKPNNLVLHTFNPTIILENNLQPLVQVPTLLKILSTPIEYISLPHINPPLQIPMMINFQSAPQLLSKTIDAFHVAIVGDGEDRQGVGEDELYLRLF
jgi:hypothetical protein